MNTRLTRSLPATACCLFAFLTSALADTSGTALVNHAPAINGTVEGSIQQLQPEDTTLNGGATITRDLLVPGTPAIRLNGKPNYGGTTDGTGPTAPSAYTVTLNGNSSLRHVVRRTAPIALPAVGAPTPPTGTRSVTINQSGDKPGDFATLSNLTLNGNAGPVTVPAGAYGEFIANGGSRFVLGVAGAPRASNYHFQRLTLNGQAQVQVLGPVVITVANGLAANGAIGVSDKPLWLKLNICSGGLTLNGGASLSGYVNAPDGTVIIDGNSQLTGGVKADRLTVNGRGLLRLVVANTPPSASDHAYATDEDTPLELTLQGSDAEENPLTYTIVSQPAHGTLAPSPGKVVPGAFTYTPIANYHGPDAFTFIVNDGEFDSTPATASIDVRSVNDRPTAEDQTLTLAEDGSASLTLAGSDVDGDALTFTVATAPAHGTVTISGAQATYVPAPNYNGSDSFTYVANDGAVDSAPASVAVSLTPVNDRPVAMAQVLALSEDGTVTFKLSGLDVDGDPLQYTIASGPAHGTLIGTAPELTYTPAPNFNGSDSFTFVVTDGTLASEPATVAIAVAAVNDQPVASAASARTAEDTSVAIPLSASDVDGDSLNLSISTPPAHGTVLLNGTAATYLPALNYNGKDTFAYVAADAVSVSTPGIVSVEIQSVNDAPVASPQSLVTPEDTALPIILSGSDVDGDALSFVIAAQPQHGTLVPTPGSSDGASFTYTPASNYNGSDSFTFSASDGTLTTGATTAAIAVTPVNDAPVAEPLALSVASGENLSVVLKGTDADGDTLVCVVTVQPRHGTLSGIGASFTYVAERGYQGPDQFEFAVTDGTATSLPAVVAIDVTAPINHAPAVDAGIDRQAMLTADGGGQPQGKILINHDEWALANEGFSGSPYAGRFARNLAAWITGGRPGRFLAYTNTVPGFVSSAYTSASLRSALLLDGHILETSATVPFTLATLRQYDAVFLSANSVDNQVLIDYVNEGGSVYISAGTNSWGGSADVEAGWYNRFLNTFGLALGYPYNGVVGSIPTLSSHPLFAGVNYLYAANGNPAIVLDASNPRTRVVCSTGGKNLYAAYEATCTTITLNGTVSDDGLPGPAPTTCRWTMASGPGPVVFENASSPETSARFTVGGRYVLRLTASDSALTANDDVVVVIDENAPPIVTAGPDLIVRDPGTTSTLAGQVWDDGKPGPGKLEMSWTTRESPAELAFADAHSAATQFTASKPGVYLAELTATDGATTVRDVAEIRVGTSYDSGMPRNGLRAWWSANRTSRDCVGGINAELLNGIGYTTGVVAAGWQFDGVCGAARIPADAATDLGAFPNGFTVEFWVKPDVIRQQTLLAWNDGGSGPLTGLSIWQDYNGEGLWLRNPIGNGTERSLLAQSVFAAGKWLHAALTYDRHTGDARIYVNGTLAASLNIGTARLLTSLPLYVGVEPKSFRPFQGVLDEISIYDRPLTREEVVAVWASGAAGKPPASQNEPPVVSAGANQSVSLAGSDIVLQGVVSDDGLPEGQELRCQWRMITGPGEVVFAAPTSASTSAHFSAPGSYLLELTADDGSLHSGDQVEIWASKNSYLPVPEGLSAWWTFNGTAAEQSGRAPAVVLANGAGFGTGVVSQGLTLDGRDDSATVPTTPALDVAANGSFTAEFWYRNPGGKQSGLLAWRPPGQARGVSLTTLYEGGMVVANLPDTAGGSRLVTTGTTTFAGPDWQHLALVYDQTFGICRIYRNGVVVLEQYVGSFTPNTRGDILIGRAPDAYSLPGNLDELALYRRALTGSEIASIYASGAVGRCPIDDAPPFVNAGSDIVLTTPAEVAALAGDVRDDNQPFGPSQLQWSVVTGPGEVTFSAPQSAHSTAVFSAAGTYLLALTASDGFVLPTRDLLEVRVAAKPAIRPAGLAAWWPANGEADDVVHGHHELRSASPISYETGKVLQAFKFGAGSAAGRVPAHADIDIGASTQGFSIEFWYRNVSATPCGVLSWNGANRPNGACIWSGYSGGMFVAVFPNTAGGSPQISTGPDTYSGADWQHVALTYDRATGLARLYRNGAIMVQGVIGSFEVETKGDLTVGSAPNQRRVTGDIDELGLYTRPLTPQEISGIYAAGIDGKQPIPVNVPPVVNAGADLSVLKNVALALTATATDDGLPNPPAALTYAWSKVAGPGNVVFSAPTALATNATFDLAGSYTLRLTASDSLLSGADDVVVTVTEPASNPPTIAFYEPANGARLPQSAYFELAVHATDSDGTIARVEFYQGDVKLGQQIAPAAGDPTTYFWPMTGGLAAGNYTFTAKATDNSGVATTSAPISVTVVADPGKPVARIATPADDGRLSAPAPVTGIAHSALLSRWQLQYRLKANEGATPESWLTLATGTSSIGQPGSSSADAGTAALLGMFDPTLLVNGLYELQLSATDTAGRTVTDGPITVLVEGNMKIGAFTLAFEDLKVPLAGLPITLTRTYDSRDTHFGDFGPGWRLALGNIRVQRNRDLGKGWWQTPQQGDGLQFYDVLPLQDRIITIVFPDGETHRFKAGAYVKVRPGDPDYSSFGRVVRQGLYKFYPIGDTTSKLEPLDASNQLHDHFWLDGTGPQDLYAGDYGDLDTIPYTAAKYRLTTKDGTVYLLNEAAGLLELRDPNGNTLVPQRDPSNRIVGVTSTQNAPAGPITTSIVVHRDATGRVDYIRDPAGRELDYAYDPQGRLASFTNRELNSTQFKYEKAAFPFYLTKILDPRGVAALRTEFDDSGRMVKQIDADGNETVFTHALDTASRSEKVKDRLGHETTYYYDDRGNVTVKVDPLGAQTSYAYYPDSDRVKFETDHYGNVKSFAYDGRGNVTVETIGASASEDPAAPVTGYTTRTSYNDLSAPTQITDADGRVQTFTYDPATNALLTHTLGAGGAQPATTTYTYNADGTPDTTTDALGTVTTYKYEANFSSPSYPGAVKKTTTTIKDASGTVVRTTAVLMDAQENQLAQIVRRTLPSESTEDVVTRFVYDAENRLAATIQPDGRVSETRYNAFGKEDKVLVWQSVAEYESRKDSAARVTSYGYDTRGNQTSVTYADGSTETAHFDAENRKDWSEDRKAQRTTYDYDAAGRLRFTTYPGATKPKTETVYDLIGRVTDTYDEMRHRTQVTYHANGTPDALRRKQSVQVLAAGNLVTSYQYDHAGNVRFVTDPRGNIVETQYDDQGRPTIVKYPATDEHPATQTETKYDALGRRITSIDQEGKITRYRYDALGRLTEVRQYLDQSIALSDSGYSLPATHSSLLLTSYTYDELGNQLTQKDALGRVTAYAYDAAGRRTKRSLPTDSADTRTFVETLQYDGWGELWKRTDFAGHVTTFTYDASGRLKSKAADPAHPSLTYSHAIARIEYDYDANGARTAARTYNQANTLLYSESTPRDERGRIDYKDTAPALSGVEGPGRLDYDYYDNGLLKDTVSSNAGSLNVGYRYDDAGRLAFVDDGSGSTLNSQLSTTSYTYNSNGSLEKVTTPNGVAHSYTYDALNRLRTLSVARVADPANPLHTYDYKLRASGHRRQVLETLSSQPSTLSSPRTTTYSYDDLYRLTGESVVAGTGDPVPSGAITYDLDKVGNRLNRVSTMAAIVSQLGESYNARDWRAGDSYTANGSTLTSSQLLVTPEPGGGGSALNPQLSGTDTYDFEERLIVRTKPDGSTINVSYDADGNRFQKTLLDAAAAVTSSTTYLVDTNNLTGYAQVVEERTTTGGSTPSSTQRVYTYGTSLISQTSQLQTPNPELQTRYYTFDGHGNVRELTDASGAIADSYTYDAFGVLIHRSGTTPNAYLYCGEQFDADLGLYYNRARYLNTDTGRFWSMDSYEAKGQDPASLHKYLYAQADPIGRIDPSGHLTLAETSLVSAAVGIYSTIAANAFRFADNPITPWEGLRQAFISGGVGAISGIVSFNISFFLKQATLLSPALRGALSGAPSAAAGQLVRELVSWVEGKPITIAGAGRRVFEASFGGFVAGGILSPFKVKFEKPIPLGIDVSGGIKESAKVVVLTYSDVATVYSSSGLIAVPGINLLQSVLKNEIMNLF